jgi:CMP-N,N'-diacetyllegionaminic acid synthase
VVANERDTVAVILARGGSVGVPRKNVIEFAGRPLITWTISQIQETGISRVYVSTDDEEISRIAESAGAKVVARPSELAGDLASGDDAVIHVIDSLNLSSETIVVIPQITSPLRLPEHITEVVSLVASGEADSVFTANRVDDICVWELTDSPKSVTYDYQSRGTRQERPPTIVENGSVYCTTVGAMRSSGNRLSGRIRASLMPKWTMPEIDEPEDVGLCEVLMRAYIVNAKGVSL